jgi:electron transport complex protein RnfD
MRLSLLALVPGLVAQVWLLDPSLAWRLALVVAIALLIESAVSALRGQPMIRSSNVSSGMLSAVLLVLLLPASTPWWMLVIGIFVALGLAKHAYGGLGQNLFNPAMAGVAALVVIFPSFFHQVVEVQPGWLGLLYALGGIGLAWLGIVSWRAPLAMLIAASLVEPTFAFFSGSPQAAFVPTPLPATLVLAAFFIVTDPVTDCSTPRGRLMFGAGCGALTVFFEHAGPSALGLPFALLTMNLAAPWLDRKLAPTRHRLGMQS